MCEATGADVSEVAEAIGRDSRIGPKFLQVFRKYSHTVCRLCDLIYRPVLDLEVPASKRTF